MATNSPAQHMAVARTGPAAPVKSPNADREIRFQVFASKLEVKLNPTIVRNIICIPTKTGQICTEAEAIKFMMLCQARGLNPYEGDCYLQGYDSRNGPVFSLITAHQAFLKRAEVNDHYDGMESGVIVMEKDPHPDSEEFDREVELPGDYFSKDRYILVGAWAKVHFKHRKFPMYKRLALDAFRKDYGRWEVDPAGMIVKCAEADALRSAFPTTIGNLYLEHELGLEKDVTPQQPAPSILPTPSGALPPPSTPPPTTPAPIQPNESPKKEDPFEEPKTAGELKEEQQKTEAVTPQVIQDKTAGMDLDGVLDAIGDLMKKDGVTEDQVVLFLRSVKIASPKQTELPQLSETKLRKLVNDWETVLPGIKEIVA